MNGSAVSVMGANHGGSAASAGPAQKSARIAEIAACRAAINCVFRWTCPACPPTSLTLSNARGPRNQVAHSIPGNYRIRVFCRSFLVRQRLELQPLDRPLRVRMLHK
jgi:hypothetical protein